jgi:hypothetical protein
VQLQLASLIDRFDALIDDTVGLEGQHAEPPCISRVTGV